MHYRGVRHIFNVPEGGSTVFSKLYKGQGLSKPKPSYDQKSIPAILQCYPKNENFLRATGKISFFKNIYNSNLLIKQPFHNLIYILSFIYIATHVYTVSPSYWKTWITNLVWERGGQSFFSIPEGRVKHYFWLYKGGSGIFSYGLRLSAIWKPSFCCLVPYGKISIF